MRTRSAKGPECGDIVRLRGLNGFARSRLPRQNWRKRSGFALVTVIWGVGLISLLITSFMTTGRLRLQAAHNIAGSTRATLLAEGGINVAILALFEERMRSGRGEAIVHDGRPYFCRLPGAILGIGIEDEGGKVDLNGASLELLTAMLIGFGADQRKAGGLAKAIVDYRSTSMMPDSADNKPSPTRPFGPKHALFDTVFEIDQVDGFDSALARALLPFVTVHSRRGGVDPRAAPPALFAALLGHSLDEVNERRRKPFPNNLDKKDIHFPAAARQVTEQSAFLAHVDVVLDGDQLSSREAILDLRTPGGFPIIRELRRGELRYTDEMKKLQREAASLPHC